MGMASLSHRIKGLSVGALSIAYLVFVINTVQVVSILFYPISPRFTRRMNRWCGRSIWGWWVLQAERDHQIKIRFTGDPIPARENALVVANHQSVVDILVLIALAWRVRRISDVKWFVKDVVKYIPGFGWGMQMIDCVFVKRDWAKDAARINELFAKYRANDIPMFLVSFLEGTRKTPEKYQAAVDFAKSRGLYAPRHTMVPRTKGFSATVMGLRDHLDAVYDVTIGYQGERAPSLLDAFSGNVERIDVHVTRHPIETLSDDEAVLNDWVFDSYVQKDDLLEQFTQDGAFPGPENLGSINPKEYWVAEDEL